MACALLESRRPSLSLCNTDQFASVTECDTGLRHAIASFLVPRAPAAGTNGKPPTIATPHRRKWPDQETNKSPLVTVVMHFVSIYVCAVVC